MRMQVDAIRNATVVTVSTDKRVVAPEKARKKSASIGSAVGNSFEFIFDRRI